MNSIEILKGTIKSLDHTISSLQRSGPSCHGKRFLVKDLIHERKMWSSILLAIETDADDAAEVIYDARTDLEAMDIL